jgi:hypothetical protein
MQEYKLTETVLSTSNFDQSNGKPQTIVQASVLDLEVLKNGDIVATAPINAKNPFQPFTGRRFEFNAKSMTDSIMPQGNAKASISMKPLDADTRLTQAKERFDKVFTQEILPRLPVGANGKKGTSEEFLSGYLSLPRPSEPLANASKDDVANAKHSIAYRYELAYAILDQQKTESEARKKK